MARPRSTSLPYVPLDPHIEQHRRTGALVDALADHTDLPHTLLSIIPIRILAYAGRQAIDGNLGPMRPGVLARTFAPEFGIPHDKLYEALTHPEDGFLVDVDGNLHVHDWVDGGGRVLAQREKWRGSKFSASSPGDISEKTPSSLVDISENSQRSPALKLKCEVKENTSAPASRDAKKPKTQKAGKGAGPQTPGGRIVAWYKTLTGDNDLDPRAAYKLVNALTAAGVTEERIQAVLEHAWRNPFRFPDGNTCTTLPAMLSEGMFPVLSKRLAESIQAPAKPTLSREEAIAAARARSEAEMKRCGLDLHGKPAPPPEWFSEKLKEMCKA